MGHSLSDHTFSDLFEMLEKVEPVNAVMEQTEGFEKPLEVHSDETPLSRPEMFTYFLSLVQKTVKP